MDVASKKPKITRTCFSLHGLEPQRLQLSRRLRQLQLQLGRSFPAGQLGSGGGALPRVPCRPFRQLQCSLQAKLDNEDEKYGSPPKLYLRRSQLLLQCRYLRRVKGLDSG
jgi:hypothetical protein